MSKTVKYSISRLCEYTDHAINITQELKKSTLCTTVNTSFWDYPSKVLEDQEQVVSPV